MLNGKKNSSKEEEIPFGRPLITSTDKKAVANILNGHVLTHGPQCKLFEVKFSNFTGGGNSVTTSSCMASLHLSSIFFKFGPGDEIIVSAQTHVATVHAIELVGATPVFIDCELSTGNIDITKLEGKINDKTKAISLVHFVETLFHCVFHTFCKVHLLVKNSPNQAHFCCLGVPAGPGQGHFMAS